MTLDLVAVIPAKGIGDSLIMMVASHRLMCQGFQVTTFSKPLQELNQWFENHKFVERPPLDKLEEIFSAFDLVVMQNDNTEFARALISLHKEGKLRALSTFYPTYEEKKHCHLMALDRVFHEERPMVDNTARAISSILGLNHISKNNGLRNPSALSHRRYKHKVVIHPTSTSDDKNWSVAKYIKLAHLLQDEGYSPIFTVAPGEREDWIKHTNGMFEVPFLPTLHELANLIYESGFMIGSDSGLGHLASNMQLPTLIISNHEGRMKLWRPGWYKGDVLTPSNYIPNIKGLRLRENKWKSFISPSKVFKTFKSLSLKETFLLNNSSSRY
ncbi:MAG: hypothetical protein S4CHLAM37_03120 [Chlamydiia bacterium]|nr:hypothetical protein [Chlamydiia bacterium]